MPNERDAEFTPGAGLGESEKSQTPGRSGPAGNDERFAAKGRPGASAIPPAKSGTMGSGAPARGGAIEDSGMERTGRSRSDGSGSADSMRGSDGGISPSNLKDRAMDQVEERITAGKSRAVDQLESFADSLRVAKNQMGDNGMSSYVGRAAQQVDDLASFLNQREVSDLVGGVEGFARRQPAAFVGGAFALGMLGARFLKSSRRDLEYGYTPRSGPTIPLDGLEDPARDAVARPDAPGYAPPSMRDG